MTQNQLLEALEQRLQFAVTASFLPTSGTLSVFGDNLDNNIVVSRNAAGQLLVNGGAVAVTGGTPTVANTALIQVFGQGGNDAQPVRVGEGCQHLQQGVPGHVLSHQKILLAPAKKN